MYALIRQKQDRFYRIRVVLKAMGLLVAVFLLLSGCSQNEPSVAAKKDVPAVNSQSVQQTVRVGHESNPMLGVLFAASEKNNASKHSWTLVPFGSGGDIGYALLAGQIDVGFVETSKASNLIKTKGADKLKVAGAVQFPYGGTLVVRKDLNIRLHDLKGRKIAASEPDCSIMVQFKKDAVRYKADIKDVKFIYLPFAEMLPALEAKAVDGALVKASYALLAELQGHKILYQNWDVQAGDQCCPAVLAQSEYLLVVRNEAALSIRPLIKALEEANALPAARIRQIISKTLNYPEAALERFPVSSFSVPSEALVTILGKGKCLIIE